MKDNISKINQVDIDLFEKVEKKETDVQVIDSHNVGYLKKFFSTFFAKKSAVVGAVITLIIFLMAFIMPAIVDSPIPDSNSLNLAPSAEHFFGTDNQGRDVFNRLWYSLRYSLILGLITTGINIFVAILLGMAMGYYRNFDNAMKSIIKIFYSIPSILLLVLLTVVPIPDGAEEETFKFWILVLGLVLTGWVSPSQQVRGATLQQKSQGFVVASKTLGTHDLFIIKDLFKYLIPTIISQIVIIFPRMILTESVIGFLGLGIPGADTLGNMISEGRAYIFEYPWQTFIPVAMLVITSISIQLFGEGLQEASTKVGGNN